MDGEKKMRIVDAIWITILTALSFFVLEGVLWLNRIMLIQLFDKDPMVMVKKWLNKYIK